MRAFIAEHSDDGQIVPYAGPLSAKLLKNGTLNTYKGFPRGMPTTKAKLKKRIRPLGRNSRNKII